MSNPFSEIRDMIHGLEADFEKFYDKQNAAAGTRVRKGMQDLKNKAQEIRLAVQDQKNTVGAAAAPAKEAAPKAAPKAAAKPAAKAPAKKK